MRILGIDYGTKRIGIAVSNPEGTFAFPLEVVPYSKDVAQEIVAVAQKNDATEVVMGESKDYKGVANPSLHGAAILKEVLEKAGLTVYWEPEFMTSVQAERFQGKTDLSDASAAALILQSYLDKRAHSILHP
jgi:putative holliday junction resolvase